MWQGPTAHLGHRVFWEWEGTAMRSGKDVCIMNKRGWFLHNFWLRVRISCCNDSGGHQILKQTPETIGHIDFEIKMLCWNHQKTIHISQGNSNNNPMTVEMNTISKDFSNWFLRSQGKLFPSLVTYSMLSYVLRLRQSTSIDLKKKGHLNHYNKVSVNKKTYFWKGFVQFIWSLFFLFILFYFVAIA